MNYIKKILLRYKWTKLRRKKIENNIAQYERIILSNSYSFGKLKAYASSKFTKNYSRSIQLDLSGKETMWYYLTGLPPIIQMAI